MPRLCTTQNTSNSQAKTHLSPATLLKKRLWHWCFPVNFAKYLRTPFWQNTSGACKGSKSMSWKFLGSLHDETIAKYVFHEMLWKKYFTVYPRLNVYNNLMVRILCLYREASPDNDTRLRTTDINKTIDLHIKFVYQVIALHQPQ